MSRVAFVGLGHMGAPMAKNLLRAGFPLQVFDLNLDAVNELTAAGARGAADVRQAVQGAEVVVSCLNDKARRFVEPLTAPLGVDLVGCNVEEDGELQALVARAAQRLDGAQREQLGVTRACAHQRATATGAQVRWGRGRCGGRRGAGHGDVSEAV